MRFTRSFGFILLAILALSVSPAVSANENVIVTEQEIEEYAQAYLKTYKNLVKDNIPSEHQSQFDFYQRYPYHVIATISTTHGAALQFIPSETESFELKTVSEKIEQAIFKDEDLNIYDVGPVDYTLIIYKGPAGEPTISIEGVQIKISNISFITNKGYFLNLSETGSVLVERISVDNVYYDYPILLKGSNHKEYWTAEIAASDALSYFETDIPDAVLTSEEFKQYLAYPELEKIAKEILDNWDKGKYRDSYLEFRKDYNDLYEAGEKYGISSEFCDAVYNFFKEQKEEQEKPSWWERYLYPVLVGVLVTLITTILGAFVRKKRAKRKDKNKEPSTTRAKRTRKPKVRRRKAK